MNVVERARATYGKSAVPIMSDRSAEYEVLARVSHRLRSAAVKRQESFPAFATALHENLRFWTALAADVAHSENRLPKDLRARIFWLAEFTASETRAILKGRGDVSALLQINAAVLQGLRGQESSE